jgi:hypothetical protein
MLDWRLRVFLKKKEFLEGKTFPNLFARGERHIVLEGEERETFSRK